MTQRKRALARRVCYALTRSALSDVIKFLLVVMGLTWLMYRGTEMMGYRWQWHRVPRYVARFENGVVSRGPLIDGLILTLRISAWSLALAFFLGLVTALLRVSDSFVGRVVARGYLELIRNTPLLVQIFFLYFVLAPVLGIGRFTSAVLALSLFEGAYVSEIFRAGIVSIVRGQWEAAYSLGLRTLDTYRCVTLDTYRCVVLPQAIRRVLPPLTSRAVSLVKDSALVSTIAIYDLTMQGQIIISETFLTFEIWFTVAALYLVVTVVLSTLVNIMENRLRVVE
ncbi:MAG: amino acid ABC transporter permease [Deltaproteobacteria bacterium]|nr:amino acid ABC transporter permease [Deltaproteobacteria bacterium]